MLISHVTNLSVFMKMIECLTPKTKVVEGKRNKDNVINQRKSPKGEKISVDKKTKQY